MYIYLDIFIFIFMIVCTFACSSLNIIGRKFWETCPESIWLFIDCQAFSVTYDLAHRPSPSFSPVNKLDWRHTGKLRKRGSLLTGEGGRGCFRSRITWTKESLVICKLFNTLWTYFIDTNWIAWQLCCFVAVYGLNHEMNSFLDAHEIKFSTFYNRRFFKFEAFLWKKK